MNQSPHSRLPLLLFTIVTSAVSICNGQMKPPVFAPIGATQPTPLPNPPGIKPPPGPFLKAPIKAPGRPPIPAPKIAQPATPQVPVPPAIQNPAKKTAHTEPAEGQRTDEKEPRDIYLNFENAELASFVDYMAEIKKLNVIPDKGLEGAKVSLTIREPLTIDEAWEVFLTVLETSGFSIVKVGEIHKIIPKDKKLNEPLPSYFNVPIEKLPDSDITIRYVVFLTNIQVDDIQQLLESMLSSPNSIIPQQDMNAFIITDKSHNIKSAIKLIQELDSMGLPEEVTVMKLKEVNASDAKELLEALIKKPDQNPLARLLGKQQEGSTEYFSPTTRIIAEPRTNSLIMLGNRKSIQKIIDFISDHIDTAVKEAESPLHIYELQHIDAGQVRDILKEVTTTQLDSATGQAAAKYGSIRGGVKYFRAMNFQVDKDGNRLIFSSIDKQDARILKDVLKDLDKPQPQVALQTMIVTVDSNDIKEMGGTIRNKKPGQLGINIDFQSAKLNENSSLKTDDGTTNGTPISLLGNMLTQLVGAQGRTALTFGPTENIWGIFRTIKTQTNASILSQPFITVANKREGIIEVGETKRVISETQGSGDGALQGFKDVQISTKLTITPQVNLDGVIRMKMQVLISEFIDTQGNQRTTRELNTDVTIADGQVLVLGGFIQTKVTEAQAKTPILGDIPVLGWIFKNKRRVITKQYIFIFLAPTILKPRQSPGMNLYTKLKLHSATSNIEDAVETKRTIDPVHNWFFNAKGESYSHKVIDFANARYQPINVDIKNDPYYRTNVSREEEEAKIQAIVSKAERQQELIQGGTPQQVRPIKKVSSTKKQPRQLVKTKPIAVTPRKKTIDPPVISKQPSLKGLGGRKDLPSKPPKKPVTPSKVPMIKTPAVKQKAAPPEIIVKKPAPPIAAKTQEPSVTPSDKIDKELARRRKKLKELLLAQPMPAPREEKPAIEEEKRDSLKRMITQMPAAQPEKTQTIDPQRRNRLKQFLSSNPALARRSDVTSAGRRTA